MTAGAAFKTIGNRYRIVSTIGAGGMGAVYRAVDRLSGKPIALKHVLLDMPDSMATLQADDLRISLSHEFRTLASLHHPNVINVVDHGFDQDRNPFFTMELLSGGAPLTDYAKPKPRGEQISLLVQLLEAMWYIHRRDVVHRDLKPGNVLVNTEGQVKVLDFGLAAARTQSRKDIEETIAGTLAYMSPELLMQESASAASDLWAVGVMAFEVFTNAHPFGATGGNLGMLIHSIINNTPDWSLIDENLVDVIQRLLAKLPGERYTDARKVIEDLCEAADIPIPKETVVVRESLLKASRFVGRDKEMERLISSLEQTMRRKPGQPLPSAATEMPQAWLIGGESGVGKSRLIEEIRVHALVQGALVLQGAGMFGGGLPFQLWREPMRRLVLDTELDDLDAAVLREVVPDIEDLLERSIPEAPSLDRDGRSKRLIATIVEVFRRQHRPTVLIVEDLQWAEESLEPLKLLNALAGEMPLMIIANYRNDERPDLPDDVPGMTMLKLERLPDTAIEELSAAMLGDYGRNQEIVNLLKRETEGNALFIVEVVRTLAEEAGGLGSIQTINVPKNVVAGGIREILRRRLNHLPEDAIGMLKLAAVSGRNIDLDVLRHIFDNAKSNGAGMPSMPDDLGTWLVECANSAVLETVEDQWRFAHDKLREVLADGLSDQERKEFNRRAALAIEAVHPDDESFAEALTDHWHLADNIERESQFAVIAAQQLLAISNYDKVENLLTRTLDRLPEGEHQQARMNLLKLRGDAQHYLSDFDSAVKTLQSSLDLARELKDQRAEADAVYSIGRARVELGEYTMAREDVEKSLEIRRKLDDRGGIADSLSLLGLVAVRQGDMETARKQYEASIPYRRENDQRGKVVDLNGLANVELREGNPQTAEGYLKQALELTRATGDRFAITVALNNLGVINENLGDMEKATDYYQQSLNLSKEIGDRQGVAVCTTNLGVVAEHEGRIMEAQDRYREALGFFREIKDRTNAALCLQNIGNIAKQLADFETATSSLEEALSVWSEMKIAQFEVEARLMLGNILRHQGSRDKAAEHGQLALKVAQENDDDDNQISAYNLLGHIAYDEGKYDEATEKLEAGIKLAREHESLSDLSRLLTRLGFTQLQQKKDDLAGSTLREALKVGRQAHDTHDETLLLQALAGHARLAYNEKNRSRSMQILNCIERQSAAMNTEVRQWVDPLYEDLENLEDDGDYLMPPEFEDLLKELLGDDYEEESDDHGHHGHH